MRIVGLQAQVTSFAECAQASVFVAILERALELGINHFETARGYGCSELQYGEAIKELYAAGHHRDELIIQTKVPAYEESRSSMDAILDLCMSGSAPYHRA